MELLIPITIYFFTLSYIIVIHLIALFKSGKVIIKVIALIATILFFIDLSWALIPYFKNENGKTFTVGGFALLYFLAVSLTVFALVAWGLVLIEKKFDKH